jgi:7-cyano-7-deazaguanine synthase
MLLLRKDGHDVRPLHVDYGHRAEQREWKSCQEICKYLGLTPNRIGIVGMESIPSGLIDINLDIEKQAFLPTRNLLFATLGAAFAYGQSSDVVALGLLANPIFPDQTPEFVKATEKCLSISLGKNVRILTPFIGMDKRDTLRLARKNNLPLGSTYYCHSGTPEPCGKCISCKERHLAEELLSKEE